MANSNNPYHRTAESYERKLRMPVVRHFRSAESKALQESFRRLIRPEDTVLDIGAGTGFYTLMLAGHAREVVAIDDSETMVGLLNERLGREGIRNVTCVHAEGSAFSPAAETQVVVAIGVLDYVKDFGGFVGRCLSLASRAVILSVPAKGALGTLFKVSALAEGSRIHTYSEAEIANSFAEHWPEWKVTASRVRLRPAWAGGLTLIIEAVRRK
jgi:2-polyprenyl-3-methyl-5-hydroxy-6-metoxy-1,4-benzoquinol methylase